MKNKVYLLEQVLKKKKKITKPVSSEYIYIYFNFRYLLL